MGSVVVNGITCRKSLGVQAGLSTPSQPPWPPSRSSVTAAPAPPRPHAGKPPSRTPRHQSFPHHEGPGCATEMDRVSQLKPARRRIWRTSVSRRASIRWKRGSLRSESRSGSRVPRGQPRQPASTALSSQRNASSFSPRKRVHAGRVVRHAPVLVAIVGRPAVRREALLEERLGFAAPPGSKEKIREMRFDPRSGIPDSLVVPSEGRENLLEELLGARQVAGQKLRQAAAYNAQGIVRKKGHRGAGLPQGFLVAALVKVEVDQVGVCPGRARAGAPDFVSTSARPASHRPAPHRCCRCRRTRRRWWGRAQILGGTQGRASSSLPRCLSTTPTLLTAAA